MEKYLQEKLHWNIGFMVFIKKHLGFVSTEIGIKPAEAFNALIYKNKHQSKSHG